MLSLWIPLSFEDGSLLITTLVTVIDTCETMLALTAEGGVPFTNISSVSCVTYNGQLYFPPFPWIYTSERLSWHLIDYLFFWESMTLFLLFI